MYKYYKNGYYISNKGKIKRIRKGKEVKVYLKTNKNGYYYFVMFNNENESCYLHRLVAEMFLIKPLGKWIVDHIDGNKKNNNVNNLRWVTNSENQLNRECHRNGSRATGGGDLG